MNKGTLLLITATAALATGVFIGTRVNTGTGTGQTDPAAGEPEQEILYWVAPMDPHFRRDAPGKSPMGMDLVPVYADAGDAITISPTVQHNLGIRTQAASVRPLWRRIEATGYVSFDETRISHINLRTQGWIVRLLVNAEGERVARGDLLFELYSPELVNAQKEYLQAHQRGDARLKQGADEKLRALGMIRSEIAALERNGQVSENIKFVAPQDGIVSMLSVREGMFVQPNTTIMSLADLSSVWLLAEVFESQADWVARGQAAEARLNYMPGEVFAGTVDYVYPVLNPDSRTLRVRLRFDNPDGRLKPNMYAGVEIFGKTHLDALSVPREALIRGPGRDRLVVALGDGRYQVHEVMTGIESGDFIEIIAGIRPGDTVVTSAQFLIDSEASLSGSIRRLEGAGPESGEVGSASVFGSGRVEAVDRERRRIRTTHGPIDALGWPAMTMEFDVEEGVRLDRIREGQSIHFSIRPGETGAYLIDMVHLVDAPGVQDND